MKGMVTLVRNPRLTIMPRDAAAVGRLTLTFAKSVRCGGCGETLPDQEGVARDCLCIRLDAIECVCPDANLETASYLDNCPKHGTAAQANEAAAEARGPWYGGQPATVTRPNAAEAAR
jgi:hypothetical protein